MTTPGLVSVVIPCYNQAHFLADSVGSVLAQTYRCFEITVVNDGSRDETAEVAARFREVNCVSQENRGLCAARNEGLRRSRGEFVVFLDADDRLRPRAFEAGIEQLAPRPRHAFTAGRHDFIDAAGAPLPVRGRRRRRIVERDHYLALLRSNYIGCPATVMYRRAAVEAVAGFDLSNNQSGDYDLYLRLAREFPVNCHAETVAEYRRHGANMSSNMPLMLRGALDALRAQLELVRGDARHERAALSGMRFYERLFESEELVVRAREHAREKRWGSAARDAFALLQRHPQVFAEHAQRKARRVIAGDGDGADSQGKERAG